MEEIEPEWNRLVEQSTFDSIFLTYEWFHAFIDSFGLADRLCVILLYDDDLVAIMPLQTERRYYGGVNFNILKSITNVHSPKYSFISRSGYENRICAALSETAADYRADMIELNYVVENSPLDKLLHAGANSYFNLQSVERLSSPHLEIRSEWKEYWEKMVPKPLRKDITRLERQAEEKYGLAFQMISGKSLSRQDLADAYEIEDSGWKGDRGTSILGNPQVKSFYDGLAWTMNEKGWFELFFLVMGGRRVAFEYCLRYKGYIAPPKIGYRAEFARYGPGNLLRKRVLEYAFNEGVRKYDLLGAADAYKLRWTNCADRLLGIYLFRKGLRGAVLKFLLFDGGRILKKFGLRNILAKRRKPS